MTVKAPSERNFRRASAKSAKRRRFRPRLSWNVVRRLLSVVLLLFGVYESIAFAFTTPLLRVNVRLSSGEVQALVEDLRGSSILRVDLDAFRQRLVESPWVADVALRRVLPSTVEVFVSERRPVGLSRMGQELYLVDETGTVIDQFGPQYSEFDLPIIDGLVPPAARGAKANASVDPARADLASRVIASLGQSQQIASGDVPELLRGKRPILEALAQRLQRPRQQRAASPCDRRRRRGEARRALRRSGHRTQSDS